MDNDYDPSPFGAAPRTRKGERALAGRPPSGMRAATSAHTALSAHPAPSADHEFSAHSAPSAHPAPGGHAPRPAADGTLDPEADSLDGLTIVDTCGVTLGRLRHEEEHAWFNELHLLAPVAYLLVGLDGSILQVNLLGADLLGVPRVRCSGKRLREFISPSFRPDFDCVVAQAFNSDAPQRCMLQVRSARRDAVPVTLVACADGSGQACRVTLERAEGKLEALEHNEERFRRIVHTAREGIWEIDASARTTFVNPMMASLLGYQIEDMLGQPLTDFTDAEGRALIERDLALRHQGVAERHEFRFVHKDGKGVWTSLATNPIFNSHGQYVGALALVSDIGERRHAVQQEWQQVNFDPLTNLPNRPMFMDRLAQELKKAERRGEVVALLLIDIDHFREANLRHGHAVGDALLVEASRRIGACVRGTDTLARVGGDEFAVAVCGLDHAGNVERIAQAIIGALGRVFEVSGLSVYVSASIGIALYPPDAASVAGLLTSAGRAIAAAKARGRNCFTYARPDLQQAALARQSMAADLRIAIADQQFEVYYQPIVTLATGAVHKAEALLRWHHPTRGLLAPAEFIPFAESSGQIVEIGNWVFRQVAEQARLWQHSIARNFQISLNKSPVQFRRDVGTYLSSLACLQELKLPPNSIVIDINESVLTDGAGSVVEILRKYREMGVQVALDDFGTGLSSLSQLTRFAIDFVKIDQSFVANLEDDGGDLALCEAIIVMAHKLGMQVVAEGVETKVQRALLVDAGCDYAQGYVFAHPMTADELEMLASTPGARLPH